jgi:hypothetical protein
LIIFLSFSFPQKSERRCHQQLPEGKHRDSEVEKEERKIEFEFVEKKKFAPCLVYFLAPAGLIKISTKRTFQGVKALLRIF